MQETTKNRASHAEVAERVAEVLRIRLDGAAFHDVVEYGRQKGWNVSERQYGRYLAQADELIAKRLDKDQARLVAMHIARRESLFARAVNTADYRTALAVLDSTAKLQNLFANERELKEQNAALTAQLREKGNEQRMSPDELKRFVRQAVSELPPTPQYEDIPPPPDDEASE